MEFNKIVVKNLLIVIQPGSCIELIFVSRDHIQKEIVCITMPSTNMQAELEKSLAKRFFEKEVCSVRMIVKREYSRNIPVIKILAYLD